MTPDKSILKLLIAIERNSKIVHRRSQWQFIVRELLIRSRIALFKTLNKNEVWIDRKIVKLLYQEIFIKSGTTMQFQDRFYIYLDELKTKKSKEEFEYLVSILKDAGS